MAPLLSRMSMSASDKLNLDQSTWPRSGRTIPSSEGVRVDSYAGQLILADLWHHLLVVPLS